MKYYIAIATLLFTLESHADVAPQSQIQQNLSLMASLTFCSKLVQIANEDEEMKWFIYEQDENNANEASELFGEYLRQKYTKADLRKIYLYGIDGMVSHLKYRAGLLKKMKNENERRAYKYNELESCREVWDKIII